MLNYVLRRLLLMIPTVIGMTFLIFMLVALSPGGVAANLAVGSGGQMDQGSVAQQRAYIEDRYGLDQPVVVQYLRWLGRVSPVKFGTRDQIDGKGTRVRPPKAVKAAPVADWLGLPSEEADADEDDDPRQAVDVEGLSEDEAKQRVYLGASGDYASARALFRSASTRAQTALGEILQAQDKGSAVRRDGRVKDGRLDGIDVEGVRAAAEPEAWSALEELARESAAARARAAVARESLLAAFEAEPYRQAGVPLVGPVWLDWPDLGHSFTTSQPVTERIAVALPVTLILNLVALPVIYFVAVPMGMLAAVRRGSWADVGSGMVFIALWSIPIPLAGVLLQGVFADRTFLFDWFPISGLSGLESEGMRFLPGTGADGSWEWGWLADRVWHLVLPVACLVYTGFAILSKQTRAAMLENFSADYVRTAKAKGVRPSDVTYRHVFRNSLLPLITMFVTIFPAMLAGSVIVESIFNIDGMGRLVLDSIQQRDREVLLGNTLILGIVNVLALLLADILYAAADPRVTYD